MSKTRIWRRKQTSEFVFNTKMARMISEKSDLKCDDHESLRVYHWSDNSSSVNSSIASVYSKRAEKTLKKVDTVVLETQKLLAPKHKTPDSLNENFLSMVKTKSNDTVKSKSATRRSEKVNFLTIPQIPKQRKRPGSQ